MSQRRSSRLRGGDVAKANITDSMKAVHASEENEQQVYHFNGVDYTSYQDMVEAKRKRNQDVLEKSGLLAVVESIKEQVHKKKKQGLQKRKQAAKDAASIAKRRKSNRIAGIQSDGLYVDDERAGHFTIAGSQQATTAATTTNAAAAAPQSAEPEHYRGRINDGEPLSIKEAVEETGPKWCKEDSVELAEKLVRDFLPKLSILEEENVAESKRKTKKSPTSVSAKLGNTSMPNHDKLSDNKKELERAINALSANSDECVAKVCPERIYSMAAHPSKDQLVICAGDKVGHVGIWNVDSISSSASSNDGVHLFRFHRGATSCLQWTSNGQALFSASYDGTARWFDVESGQFEEIFATYDDDKAYKNKMGFGLDTGSHFWTQYACLDHRHTNEKCMFLSTSVGTAMHIDLRAKKRITFHEELSEKKINTLSLHPNGYSLISAGLDCIVSLWDLRKLGDSRTTAARRKAAPESLAYYNGGRSVNSAFFSPSGQYIVSTTMANKLDIFDNMHLVGGSPTPKKKSSSLVVKPYKSIRHDNMTGRWLTTFQAVFHPELDNIFCVGSMRKPRAVELFDASSGNLKRAVTGDALTAVASRLCFHPRTDKLILAGGNSSGRVTIIR